MEGLRAESLSALWKGLADTNPCAVITADFLCFRIAERAPQLWRSLLRGNVTHSSLVRKVKGFCFQSGHFSCHIRILRISYVRNYKNIRSLSITVEPMVTPAKRWQPGSFFKLCTSSLSKIKEYGTVAHTTAMTAGGLGLSKTLNWS